MGLRLTIRTLSTGIIKCFCGGFTEAFSVKNYKVKMAGRFRSYVWDPALIIAQIISLQCIFYVFLGLLTAAFLAMGGYHPSLRHIFDCQSVHFRSRENQIVMVTHVLNSLFGAITLWFVIQRAKQCLDFTCTLHFFHFVTCWVYTNHFPTSIIWWLVQLVCIVLMVVIGEYLCFRTAMKEIPVMGARTDV